MNIKELNAIGIDRLRKNNIDDYINKAERLLQYVLNMTKIEIVINFNAEVKEDLQFEYLFFIDEIIKGKPLQYITNNQEFMKLNFYVDENVLIPQPDTEILAEKAIELAKMKKDCKILDLCTGSGAIGIAIKKYVPKAKVYASDISKKALEIARKNAIINDVYISFIYSDMFENIKDRKFDIIVSNPPYIETGKLKSLPLDVQNEPKLALDGGEDGLKFYKMIEKNGYKILEPDGKMLLEIGYNQEEAVVKLFDNDNYKNVSIYKDLANISRVIKVEKS